jgi:hypothetical protein
MEDTSPQFQLHPAGTSRVIFLLLDMENLREGGVFAALPVFTKALTSWTVGTFGEVEKFKVIRRTGCTLDFQCRICESSQTTGCPVHIQIKVHRKTVKSRKISKDQPVTVTKWILCDCKIKEVAIRAISQPAVRETFATRTAFNDAMRQFCLQNRKLPFSTKQKGSKCERKCRRTDCPGKVVVCLTRTKKSLGGHSWTPPLTVTESTPCLPLCKEPGTRPVPNPKCLQCLEEDLPLSEFISGICCHKDHARYCYPCFMIFLQKRPVHAPIWKGNPHLKNKVVEVGTQQGQIGIKCPFLKCPWKHGDTFTYKNERFKIGDLIPIGFDGEDPVNDRNDFDQKLRLNREDLHTRVHQEVDQEDEEAAMNAVAYDLAAIVQGPPDERNIRRRQHLQTNTNMTVEAATRYLREHRLWDSEVIEIME